MVQDSFRKQNNFGELRIFWSGKEKKGGGFLPDSKLYKKVAENKLMLVLKQEPLNAKKRSYILLKLLWVSSTLCPGILENWVDFLEEIVSR